MTDLTDLELIEINQNRDEIDLSTNTQTILADIRTKNEVESSMVIPIGQLSLLGAGVSSLIPSLSTINTSSPVPVDGLYRIANQAAGDVLKIAKNGNSWGAMKTADGASKMAQLSKVTELPMNANPVSTLNPTTIMMAATLYSIERQLGEIAETQKQILSFLEIKDEANVEGDLETLNELITNYKHNWDNEIYVQNSHKLVMDIKRTSRTNMISNQKRIEEILKTKKLLVSQGQLKSSLTDLENTFKYYRLSLYTYSLASMAEVMMGGNFKESYVKGIQDEVVKLSEIYRNLFAKGSLHLEKMGGSSLEANLLKGIGVAGKSVGKVMASLPLIKEGTIDGFLEDRGNSITENAIGLEKKAVRQFAKLGNPGTGAIVGRISDILLIHNRTNHFLVDDNNIYLMSE